MHTCFVAYSDNDAKAFWAEINNRAAAREEASKVLPDWYRYFACYYPAYQFWS